MKPISNSGAFTPRNWRKPNLGLFWQLIIAFTLITTLVAGGMLMAGRAAFSRFDSFVQDRFSPVQLWTSRLASYYGEQGSWEQVDALIAGYPCGPGWEPWNEDWQMAYALATADGTVVSASDRGRLGQALARLEMELAVPIVVNDQPVGVLFLYPFVRPGPGPL